MKAHERSVIHIRASQTLLVTSLEGSVMQQLQRKDMLQKENKRELQWNILYIAVTFLPVTTLLTLLISLN